MPTPSAISTLLSTRLPREQFFNAVLDGNVEAVKSWLDRGMPIDVRDPGLSFSKRIHREDPAYVAEKNRQSGRMPGTTAFHYSVRARHMAMIEMLLERGADPSLVDDQIPKGKTPLQVLAEGVIQTPWLDWEEVMSAACALLLAGVDFSQEKPEHVEVIRAWRQLGCGAEDRFMALVSGKQAEALEAETPEAMPAQMRTRRI